MQVKEGQKIWIVEGSHQNNSYIHEVLIQRVFSREIEIPNYYTESVSVEKYKITDKMIDDAEGLNKLILQTGPMFRTLNVVTQGVKLKKEIQLFIEDTEEKILNLSTLNNKIFFSKKEVFLEIEKQTLNPLVWFEMYSSMNELYPEGDFGKMPISKPILNIGTLISP